MVEQSKIGITLESVQKMFYRAAFFTTDITQYNREVYKEIVESQRELLMYLIIAGLQPGINNSMLFATGAAMTFDMLPDHHKVEPLTSVDIDLVHKNITDHPARGAMSRKTKLPLLNIDWYWDIVREDSPIYAEWLQIMLADIKDPHSQSDFLLGSVTTSLPFYSREEAKRLSLVFS